MSDYSIDTVLVRTMSQDPSERDALSGQGGLQNGLRSYLPEAFSIGRRRTVLLNDPPRRVRHR